MEFVLRFLLVACRGAAATLERLLDLWIAVSSGDTDFPWPALGERPSDFAANHLQLVWERLEAHDAEEC